MAAPLNSLSFAFTNSFLPKYRVKYYDYIIKWCSGLQCNWCVSMDIDSILALRLWVTIMVRVHVNSNEKCT